MRAATDEPSPAPRPHHPAGLGQHHRAPRLVRRLASRRTPQAHPYGRSQAIKRLTDTDVDRIVFDAVGKPLIPRAERWGLTESEYWLAISYLHAAEWEPEPDDECIGDRIAAVVLDALRDATGLTCPEPQPDW